MITSTHNPKIKLVRQLLTQTKARKKQGAFVLEGIRLLEEAFNSHFSPQLLLYTADLDQRGLSLVNKFESGGVNCEITAPNVFNSASDTETPQGILAVYPLISLPIPERADFLLIAEDPFSPKVVRAAMGAHFHLPIKTASWPEIEKITRNLAVYLADMDQGPNLWQPDLTEPLGIIIGGEAHGPGKNARELTNKILHIPMSEKSESINAAAAGAVFLYEIRRQRTLTSK
jgi:TrmH family RNA methyltransferase